MPFRRRSMAAGSFLRQIVCSAPGPDIGSIQ